jgi:MOSC domain-containing protein YiiM
MGGSLNNPQSQEPELMSVEIEAMYAGAPRPIGNNQDTSSIDKLQLPPPWRISRTGLVGDSQADMVHLGGPEKALHHYAREHYATWRADYPDLADAMPPVPAFGENISTLGVTEETICVGDIWRAGNVILQVSQGRQPCWKLNFRFSVPDMARRVQSSGKTGWYYRVLEPGVILPGAALTLIERPQPDWSLARILSLLYLRPLAFEELAELANVQELSESWRRLALRRLASQSVENWAARLGGGPETDASPGTGKH